MHHITELALIIPPNHLSPHTSREQLETLMRQFSEQEALRQALALHIDIEDIRQRYDADKSFFSTLADRYVSLHWWMKLVLGLSVIGIGWMINISIWVSVVCYVGLALLIFEHCQKNERYQAPFFEDMRRLQTELENTIEHTDAIKVAVLDVIGHLNNLNIELAQSHAIHQAQIQELNFQIECSQTIIRNLAQTTESLQLNLSNHKEELDKAYTLVHHHEQTLEKQSIALQDINTAAKAEIAIIKGKRIELEEKCRELSEILHNFLPGDPKEEVNPIVCSAQTALKSSELINNAINQMFHTSTP